MWTVPDKGEGDNDLQSVLFQEYLDVLVAGLQGLDCVVAGCAVTGGADMTPAVAAGVVRSDGTLLAVTAGDVTIGAANATNPRIDLIVVDSAGAKAVRAGTAAVAPKPPARSANDVVLAAVYVPANDTSIETTKITDLRVVRNQADLGHIFGLTMSNAADTVNDITVSAGEATDEDSVRLMVLALPITKQLDVGWAAGTNAGGLNTGAKANSTWYEVHLISRDDTGVVDVMFTTTANRATLPANYTRSRRIGWIRNNATPTILQFIQDGDYFTLVTQINDVAASATATATLAALTVPPNSIARFRASLVTGGGGTNLQDQAIVFSDPDEGNVTPTGATGISSLITGESVAAILPGAAGHFEVRVNAASQIEHDSSANAVTGTCVFDISTFGWIDRRRRVTLL